MEPTPYGQSHHGPANIPRRVSVKGLKLAAQELKRSPTPQSSNRVKVRGERLSRPIYWRGQQWAVTRFGVEARNGTYCIAKNRLWQNEERYGWVMHMAEKVWVNVPDFAEALRIARQRYSANMEGVS